MEKNSQLLKEQEKNMALVKIIEINTNDKCSCGSWLGHWVKHSREASDYCSEKNCTVSSDLIGVHVHKVFSTDDKQFIIPLCKTHSQSKEQINISDRVNFVPANKNETCEKKVTGDWKESVVTSFAISSK